MVMAFVFFVSSTYAEISYPDLPLWSTVPCDHGTPGSTTTKPLFWNSAADLWAEFYDSQVETIMSNQATPFPGSWDFQISTEATGEINVDVYTPRDGTEECEHGARLDISVPNLVLPAGQQLQWMNLYTESSGSSPDIVDPFIGYTFPEDPPHDVIADPRPFYYNIEGLGSGTHKMPSDKHFSDTPADFIDDDAVPHFGDLTFSTLITSWNGTYSGTTDNVVTIYGRIDWGFTYECSPSPIPEPGTMLMLGLGGILLRRKR